MEDKSRVKISRCDFSHTFYHRFFLYLHSLPLNIRILHQNSNMKTGKSHLLPLILGLLICLSCERSGYYNDDQRKRLDLLTATRWTEQSTDSHDPENPIECRQSWSFDKKAKPLSLTNGQTRTEIRPIMKLSITTGLSLPKISQLSISTAPHTETCSG